MSALRQAIFGDVPAYDPVTLARMGLLIERFERLGTSEFHAQLEEILGDEDAAELHWAVASSADPEVSAEAVAIGVASPRVSDYITRVFEAA